MSKIVFIVVLISFPFLMMGQTRTVVASGAWNAGATWQSGDIADALGEDVVFTVGEKTASIPGGYTPTVGNVDLGTSGNISISGSLSIGSSGNPRNLIGSSDERTITVSGNLTIWGNVTFTQKVNWFVSGTVLIKGNLTMGDDSYISGSGSFSVNGSFTSGTNTLVQNSNLIDVDGPVQVGTGSLLQNSGTFTALSCSGPSSFCATVLPVTLKTFEGYARIDRNVLDWITTSEYNFDKFIIEHSVDGQSFVAIGESQGAQRNLLSIETTYSFADIHPVIGVNYYRLKSLDLDGYFEYSSIINVRWEGPKKITLYPNPTEGSFITLIQNFQSNESTIIQVFDHLGVLRDVFQLQGTLTNELHFHDQLSSGNYFLKFVGSDFTDVVKFSVW
jgi:hypothetical protein